MECVCASMLAVLLGGKPSAKHEARKAVQLVCVYPSIYIPCTRLGGQRPQRNVFFDDGRVFAKSC